MRHASREGTNRFHPLRLLQPFLHDPGSPVRVEAVADVPDDQQHGWLALVREGHRPDLHRQVNSIQPVQRVPDRLGDVVDTGCRAQLPPDRLQVGRIEQGINRERQELPGTGGAGQVGRGAIGHHDLARGVHQNAVGSEFHQTLEAFIHPRNRTRDGTSAPGDH